MFWSEDGMKSFHLLNCTNFRPRNVGRENWTNSELVWGRGPHHRATANPEINFSWWICKSNQNVFIGERASAKDVWRTWEERTRSGSKWELGTLPCDDHNLDLGLRIWHLLDCQSGLGHLQSSNWRQTNLNSWIGLTILVSSNTNFAKSPSPKPTKLTWQNGSPHWNGDHFVVLHPSTKKSS